jgi:hypothetical protein
VALSRECRDRADGKTHAKSAQRIQMDYDKWNTELMGLQEIEPTTAAIVTSGYSYCLIVTDFTSMLSIGTYSGLV